MKFIKYLLNAPWTLLGLVHLVLCRPTSVALGPDALVFRTKSCGLGHMFLKHMHGLAIGNIVVAREVASEKLVGHELVHVEQFMRYPFVFPFMYVRELVRNGYWNSTYEKEAYDKTNTWPRSKRSDQS